MTGITDTDQTFYRSPRYNVKQLQSLASPTNAEAVDISATAYTQTGAPFVVVVGTTGTVIGTTVNGDTATFVGVPAGGRVGGGNGVVFTSITKTGTTASNMVALN